MSLEREVLNDNVVLKKQRKRILLPKASQTCIVICMQNANALSVMMVVVMVVAVSLSLLQRMSRLITKMCKKQSLLSLSLSPFALHRPAR